MRAIESTAAQLAQDWRTSGRIAKIAPGINDAALAALLEEAVKAGAEMAKVRVVYEVRQQVRTVRKNWLETVFDSTFERPAKDEYDRLVQQNPSEYFELVRLSAAEECLAHSNQVTKPTA